MRRGQLLAGPSGLVTCRKTPALSCLQPPSAFKPAAEINCKVAWSTNAWDDYLYWQEKNLAIVAEINGMIEEISRDPFKGTGKPKPLKGDLTGFWSRRITKVTCPGIFGPAET